MANKRMSASYVSLVGALKACNGALSAGSTTRFLNFLLFEDQNQL